MTVAPRIFTLADQHAFADWSGDWNPIHVDPVAARRTLVGEAVVHGVHTLLWALDRYFAAGGAAIIALRVAFMKPVLLGPAVEMVQSREDNDIWLKLMDGGDILAAIRLTPGDAPPGPAGVALPDFPRSPRAWTFAALKSAAGTLPVAGNSDALRAAFPAACASLGVARVVALMTLSRLVGMEVPGAHSLFAGIDISLTGNDALTLDWNVTRAIAPQAPLVVAVLGGGLAGTITAFMRPAPAAQPSVAQVADALGGLRLEGQRALVVGGSRGLGEVIAKVVAAAGGRVTITYHRGEAEALSVQDEIRAFGGACDVAQFDADSANSQGAVELLAGRPTHLYYLASPPITPSLKGVFDGAKARKFNRVYVETFALLCLAAGNLPDFRAFYPSSVFVAERPKGFLEYCAAKAAGESLCDALNDQQPGLSVLADRLPRLRTDQTAAFMGKAAAEPLAVMVDVVRRLQSFKKGV
jgi:hypothetical protein